MPCIPLTTLSFAHHFPNLNPPFFWSHSIASLKPHHSHLINIHTGIPLATVKVGSKHEVRWTLVSQYITRKTLLETAVFHRIG